MILLEEVKHVRPVEHSIEGEVDRKRRRLPGGYFSFPCSSRSSRQYGVLVDVLVGRRGCAGSIIRSHSSTVERIHGAMMLAELIRHEVMLIGGCG